MFASAIRSALLAATFAAVLSSTNATAQDYEQQCADAANDQMDVIMDDWKELCAAKKLECHEDANNTEETCKKSYESCLEDEDSAVERFVERCVEAKKEEENTRR